MELKEESFKEPLSEKERLQIVTKEGERILGRIGNRSFVFVLIPGAKPLFGGTGRTSQPPGRSGTSQVEFVIGEPWFGSRGLTARTLSSPFPSLRFLTNSCASSLPSSSIGL